MFSVASSPLALQEKPLMPQTHVTIGQTIKGIKPLGLMFIIFNLWIILQHM